MSCSAGHQNSQLGMRFPASGDSGCSLQGTPDPISSIESVTDHGELLWLQRGCQEHWGWHWPVSALFWLLVSSWPCSVLCRCSGKDRGRAGLPVILTQPLSPAGGWGW